MRRLSSYGTFGVLVLLLAFAGCALPNMSEFTAVERSSLTSKAVTAAAVAYEHTDASITLEWDAASGPVAAYRIYARDRNGGDWTLIEEIAATAAPSYEVLQSATGAGSFAFAVSSVDSEGNESVKHTSVDEDADPPSGWYVIWEASP